jgi:hypothetical protein
VIPCDDRNASTLDLPTGQPVLDVEGEPDQRLREADRPVLVGRRLEAYVSTTC